MAASFEHKLDSSTSVKRRKTDPESKICEELLKLEEDLCQELSSLSFASPVSFVYNPLEYAKETHEDYVRKYCKVGQNVLFLGMNPGPFGMAQNGVSLKMIFQSVLRSLSTQLFINIVSSHSMECESMLFVMNHIQSF